ncbi:hypothetical protein [Zobellia roscoffensis]|uniref:hypothetical protein n=1 Tax=Zobellia roscoffensis TaxID=2779508 RepID=UPI00188C24D7|nr:hypothetical protein [Zobellia roscoffensis]
MIGFIKLPREILDWEWYTHPTVSRLYIHLLVKANYTDKCWQGNVVKRGQLITSYKHLAAQLNITIQQVRTALKKLSTSGYITYQPTNRFSLITIVEYDNTQNSTSEINKQSLTLETHKKHSGNNPITTTKENKEIYKSKEEFRRAVFSHSNHSKIILKSFFNYWSETNKTGKTMRVNGETYFDVSVRIEKWKKNERAIQNKDYKLSTNR